MTTSVLPQPMQTIVVRAPLEAPAADPRLLLRAVRSAVVWRSFALGGVLLALCLLHVWVHHSVDAVGRQIWEAHKLLERLEQERNELTLERETHRDHAWLAGYAQSKLGLVPPRKGQIIEVR